MIYRYDVLPYDGQLERAEDGDLVFLDDIRPALQEVLRALEYYNSNYESQEMSDLLALLKG